MADSSCASKQQKKREKRTAKRLLKKINDENVEVKKNADPLEILKEKLAEAKTAGNHNLAMKLRQDLWVLQDTSAGHNPSLSKEEVETSLSRIEANYDQTTPDEQSFQNPTEKRLRNLNKKLKQIEVLKTRLKNGEELEASQIAKIDSEDKILEEINEINREHALINVLRRSKSNIDETFKVICEECLGLYDFLELISSSVKLENGDQPGKVN